MRCRISAPSPRRLRRVYMRFATCFFQIFLIFCVGRNFGRSLFCRVKDAFTGFFRLVVTLNKVLHTIGF